MACKMLLLGISLFTLAACSREVEIDVAHRGGKVTFAVTRSGQPVCIDRIAVYEGPEETHTPMWSVMSGPEPRCESRFTLGESPRGFSASERIEPQRLRRGRVFTVSAGGPGLRGATTFTIS